MAGNWTRKVDQRANIAPLDSKDMERSIGLLYLHGILERIAFIGLEVELVPRTLDMDGMLNCSCCLLVGFRDG
jgi:hypothetical protein